MELIRFVFSGLWHFIGFIIVLGMVIALIDHIFKRAFRHATLRKHSYPPLHCDADGSFKNEEDDE